MLLAALRCDACAGPEVLTGKYGTSQVTVISARELTQAQDVWSYGVTLFELMNHQLPFKTRDEVLHGEVVVCSALSCLGFICVVGVVLRRSIS